VKNNIVMFKLLHVGRSLRFYGTAIILFIAWRVLY